MSNPKMHNLYEAYSDMYEALGIKNVNVILPPPKKPAPMDPAMENIHGNVRKTVQSIPRTRPSGTHGRTFDVYGHVYG